MEEAAKAVDWAAVGTEEEGRAEARAGGSVGVAGQAIWAVRDWEGVGSAEEGSVEGSAEENLAEAGLEGAGSADGLVADSVAV